MKALFCELAKIKLLDIDYQLLEADVFTGCPLSKHFRITVSKYVNMSYINQQLLDLVAYFVGSDTADKCKSE